MCARAVAAACRAAWGYTGLSTGDSANDLLHVSADPNVNIETTKAMTCDVRAGRRASPATSRVTTAAHGTSAPDRDHPAERATLGRPEATA
jgi:formate dehydrogenase major subunit